MFSLSSRRISAANLALMHFLVFSIGLTRLAMAAAHQVYLSISFDHYLQGIFDWAAAAQLDKPAQLLEYGLPIAVLFPYFFIASWLINRINHEPRGREATCPAVPAFAYLVVAFLSNIAIVWAEGGTPLFVYGLWGLGFALAPLLYLAGIGVLNWTLKPKYSLAILGLIFLQLSLVFMPLVFSPVFVRGDYFDIPEQTRLDGRWVDDIGFVNSHNIHGLHKYDPRVEGGENQVYTNAVHVKINKSPLLANFLQDGASHKYKFSYDDAKGWLIAYDTMTPAERLSLEDMYAKPEDKEAIDKLYWMSSEYRRNLARHVQTKEESEFIAKNDPALFSQVRAGWFFHHQNYMLGAMHALQLGMPQSNVTMVYGWLNTVALAAMQKAMGGVNFQHYFSLMFAIYPLYYVLLGLFAYAIFRKPAYVLLVLMGAVGAMFLIGYQLTLMAPGFNPSRHIFDLPVFGLLYFYFKSDKKKWLYLALALGLSWFFILWNKQFGAFALISVLGALLYDGIGLPKPGLRMLKLLAAAVVGAILYILPHAGKNPALVYMLLGVSGPPIARSMIMQILLVLLLLYVLLLVLRARAARDPLHSLTVAIFLYCQLELIYVVWYPAMHHLWDIAPALVILAALLFRQLFVYYKAMARLEDATLSVLTVVVLAFFYLPASALMELGKIGYCRYEQTHKTYDWKFENAKFRTSMDPALFEEAVDQIRKYSDRNSIYLISKYDNILPILSDKFNDLPFMEVATNLVTKKEVALVCDKIREASPQYIFIDTDVDRNLNGEIAQQGKPEFVVESFVRVQILSKLKYVYEGLKDMYVPIEKGHLITVYERKDLLAQPLKNPDKFQ